MESMVGTAVGYGLALLIYAIIGLAMGVLGRLFLPGPDPQSIGATILFGIGGAVLGAIVGMLLRLPEAWIGFLGIAGAMLLLWFDRKRVAARR
jgi:uncharacterized membrane protein YeaQ/YmgE (transglycosylase-associated protein family)